MKLNSFKVIRKVGEGKLPHIYNDIYRKIYTNMW